MSIAGCGYWILANKGKGYIDGFECDGYVQRDHESVGVCVGSTAPVHDHQKWKCDWDPPGRQMTFVSRWNPVMGPLHQVTPPGHAVTTQPYFYGTQTQSGMQHR